MIRATSSRGLPALCKSKLVQDISGPGNGPFVLPLASGCRKLSSNPRHKYETAIKDKNVVRATVGGFNFNLSATFPDAIRSMMTKWENDVAYECLETGVKFTHKQVMDYSKNFAAALYQAGLRRGNVVGLSMTNTPWFPVAFFGIIEAGMTANLLSPDLPKERLQAMIEASKTRAILAPPDKAAIYQQIKDTPAGRRIKLVISSGVKGCHDIRDMIKVNSQGVDFPKANEIDTEQYVPVLYWSSGTTGPPKAVQTLYPHLKAQLQQWIHPEFASYKPGDVTIAALPFYHAYANICQIRVASAVGAKVLTMPKFDRNVFAAAIKKHKPSVINGVPTLIEQCATHPDLKREDFSKLHTFTNGAYVVPVKVLDNFFDRAGKHVFVQDLYGTSEAGMTHAVPQAFRQSKYGTIGRLLPYQIARVVDSNGKTLGIGEKGELHIMGPQLMKGYMNNDTATKEALDQDGWSHTGDVAYYDRDRFFYVVGRTKDMIKYKGAQISPVLLQDILNSHPKIRDSAVVGIPDKKNGELPRAYIVLENKTQRLTPEEINAYLEEKVMPHERLRGGIEFIKEIPKSTVGKIERNELINKWRDAQRK